MPTGFPVFLLVYAALLLPVAAPETAPPSPFEPVPNGSQLEWHKAEYRMFIHFGMKTFHPSRNHMGSGKEDPETFHPVDFDADQWVQAAKAGGFEGIVLTTKHHDGFCNWPTDTTDHCVRSSPWRDGKGDVVGDLISACRRGGLTFGFYLSIIDRHFEQAGAAGFESYGDFYLEQIRELSTRYGPIDEYWFDGYKADALKLDYEGIAEVIRHAQPSAVVYDSGTLVEYLPDRCLAWPNRHGGVGPDQNYRRELDGKLRWYPNEPSIILQGNWFHDLKPAVSLARMQDYYLSSVGVGVTPLMNIGPNRNGLIDEETILRLEKLKAWVDELHRRDLARGIDVTVAADSVRGDAPEYGAASVLDGKYDTYHATDDDITTAVVELRLGAVREIDGVILQEYIPLGQRVTGWAIDCRVGGEWAEVCAGKTIGYKRIVLEGRGPAKQTTFPATDRIRLRITGALACPLINTFQVVGD